MSKNFVIWGTEEVQVRGHIYMPLDPKSLEFLTRQDEKKPTRDNRSGENNNQSHGESE